MVIHPESPALNQARIASRRSEGGHNVPAESVISRIPRLLELVKASLPLLDVLPVFDNSAALDPFLPVFTISHGSLALHQDPLPCWAAGALGVDQAT